MVSVHGTRERTAPFWKGNVRSLERLGISIPAQYVEAVIEGLALRAGRIIVEAAKASWMTSSASEA